MAITKPPVLPAWAESGDKVTPSNAEIQVGWPLSSIPPSRQRFNWLLNFLANGIRYFSRRGLPDYDAAETYMIGDRIIGDDGKTYRSLIDNNTAQTPSTSPTKWERWALTLAEMYTSLTTPAQFDNSVKPATTAFVQRALGNMQGGVVLGAPQVLSAADVGKVFSLNVSASPITLPLYSTVPSGAKISFVNIGSTNVVIQRSGTDTLFGPSGVGNQSFSSALTSYTLLPGDCVEFTAVSQWEITGGTCLLQAASSFVASKAGAGYQKLPSGLIIQWGQISAGNGVGVSVSLPIAFPNAGLVMTASHAGGGSSGSAVTAVSLTTTTAYVNNSNPNVIPHHYIAIGY